MSQTLTIQATAGQATINRNIYGHFSEHLGHCIYGGYWVGEDSSIPNTRGIRNDVVEALRAMGIPVLRWPGGCFADEYHWMDGIGPKSQRPEMVNTHWGGVTENNHFGTHEFLDLCEQLGCEPYICGNVGSGTVREMQQWVEYISFDGLSPMANLRRANGRQEPWHLTYWGVGNETWGCGGHMRPEYYADLYRQFQTYLRNMGPNTLYKIACGANSANYNWTEVLMREAGALMHGITLHYYTVPKDWSVKGSATQFGEDEWFATLRKTLFMEELVTRHSTIMDQYDPAKQVGLMVDEWGTWYDVEPGTNPGFLYMQSTMRDALVAGINLNIFNQHADRVRMSNIAQTVNVLQSVILTDGPRMLLTPTYHVFEMYKVHHDATLLPTNLTGSEYGFEGQGIPALQVSASRNAEGVIHVSLCNLGPHQSAELDIACFGAPVHEVSGRVLTGEAMNTHNTFDEPEQVQPTAFTAYKLADGALKVTLPAKSVTVLALK